MKTTTKLGLVIASGVTILSVTAMAANAQSLTRDLQIGMSGSDVGVLQVFLSKDPSVYPQGKVTDYFGFLTKAAVSNFQSKNGISAIGRVGPQTRAVINAQIASGGTYYPPTNTNGVAPVKVSSITGNNNGTANISWTTAVPSTGVVHYSTSPLSTYENENSVTIGGSTVTAGNLQTSQSVVLSGIQPGFTYYYSIYTTDQNGNVNMTWPTTFKIN